MAVVNVKESWSRVFAERAGGNWTARKAFTVLMDNAADGPELALQATGIPIEGEGYGSPALSFNPTCSRVRIADRRGPLLYTIEAEYTTGGIATGAENPLTEPIQIAFKTVTIEEDATADNTMQRLTTTAGEPLHGLKRDRSDTTIVLKANFASFDIGFAESVRNCVNSDVFMGAERGSVKCNTIDAVKKFKGDLIYWEVDAQLQHTIWPPWVPRYPAEPRANGFVPWDYFILNEGTMELDAGGALVNIKEGKGKTANSTYLIDEDGHAVRTDPVGHEYWLYREKYDRVSFSAFGG